jgi:hypothetical protein
MCPWASPTRERLVCGQQEGEENVSVRVSECRRVKKTRHVKENASGRLSEVRLLVEVAGLVSEQ